MCLFSKFEISFSCVLFFVICRKVFEKTEKVSFFVGAGQEKGSIDDGYCWRKYGQKEIHGSINPRYYY